QTCALPICLPPVAVVETRRIPAGDAVGAATAAFVGFDADAIPDAQLVDPGAQLDHRAGPLVTGGKLAVRWLTWERMLLDLQIGPAHAAHGDLDQHLARGRHGDGFVDNAELARPQQPR